MPDCSASLGVPFARSATGLGIASGWGVKQRKFRERLGKVVEVARSLSAVLLGAAFAAFCTAPPYLHVRPSEGAQEVQVPNALGPIARYFGNSAAAAEEVAG